MVENYLSIRQSPDTFKKIANRGKLLHRAVNKIQENEWVFSAYAIGRKYYIVFGSNPHNQCLYEYKGYKDKEEFLKKEWDTFFNDEVVSISAIPTIGDYDVEDMTLDQKIALSSVIRFIDRGWCFRHELGAQMDTIKYTYSILNDDSPIYVDEQGDLIVEE